MSDGGKGSKPRPYSVSYDDFSNSFDRIFGKKENMQIKATENTEEFGKCGCGRSPSGKCIGLHTLSEKEWVEGKTQILANIAMGRGKIVESEDTNGKAV